MICSTSRWHDLLGVAIFCAAAWLFMTLAASPWAPQESRNGLVIGFAGGYCLRWAVEYAGRKR